MPNANSAKTLLYAEITSKMLPLHADPIWVTISLAVCHAFSFAIAGSKSEPERKNNRVNDMKINVINIAQVRSNHENPMLYLLRL